MGLGDSYTLKLSGAKNPLWKSSNSKIAVVKNGKVIAKKTGKVTVTATYKGKSYKCIILVKAPKISSAKFSMTVGTKKQVKILNTINKVTWVSSNKSIATIDKNGLVTARKAGTVKITGKLHGKRYTSVVTVKKSLAKAVSLNKTSAKLLIGGTLQLKLNNATGSKVSWKTSNKNIATVDKNGKVVPKKAGKATITATYNKKSYKCTITIPQPSITPDDVYALELDDSVTFKVSNIKGSVAWKSSDTSVAEINSLGKIRPKKAGRTTITARIGSYTIKRTVQIVDKTLCFSDIFDDMVPGDTMEFTESVILSYTDGLVSVDGAVVKMLKSGTAKVIVKHANGLIGYYEFIIKKSAMTVTEMQLELGFSDVLDILDNKFPITWSSSNPAIVTVDSDGMIVGKKKGTAIIIGLAGGVKYTCRVTVVDPDTTGWDNDDNYENSDSNDSGGNNSSDSGENDNDSSLPDIPQKPTYKYPIIPADQLKTEVVHINWNEDRARDATVSVGGLFPLFTSAVVRYGVNNVQFIVDGTPGPVTFKGEDDYITCTEDGLVTAMPGVLESNSGLRCAGFSVICNGKILDFMLNVQETDWEVPNKKTYYYGYSDTSVDFEIPVEARPDVFDYFVGNSFSTVEAKYETAYGNGSPYLDFGNYVVKGIHLVPDEVRGVNLSSKLYESADRILDIFKQLNILDKPDYIKVREIARWFNSQNYKIGDYVTDGTMLGTKMEYISEDYNIMFDYMMWLLDIKYYSVGGYYNPSTGEELRDVWSIVELDGQYYFVDISPNSSAGVVYSECFTPISNPNNAKAIANTISSSTMLGTKYLYGCKVLTYNSLAELKADLNNTSSKLYKQHDLDQAIAINVPVSIQNDADALISAKFAGVKLSAYQNPNSTVANANDKSRITLVTVDKNAYYVRASYPLKSLSYYTK